MITWQEGDVLTNGIRIHYYRSGGDKPPIVLSHGITDSGLCWPLVAEALADQYEVITVDARGHGKSEKPEDPSAYAREEHARDLAGLIEELGLNRPAIMGHSMGAGTAGTVGYLWPELVGVLVLEDPPWRDMSLSESPYAHSEEWRMEIIERKKLSKDELIQKGRADNPSWSTDVFEPWSNAKFDVSANVVGYITATKLTWEEAATGIQCPTLLITADPELGAIVTAPVADAAQKMNEQIEVVNVPGVGHNIRREGYPAFIDYVKAFLAKTYPGA